MIDQYFNEFDRSGTIFGAFGEYFSGEPNDIGLLILLNIEKTRLKIFAIDLLSKDIPESLNVLLKDIERGIRAYLQFQDILDISFSTPFSTSLEDILIGEFLNRHYCYYESLTYLRESILSLLDINTLASITLLRPFLELSIAHLYWYITGNSDNFKKYYLWVSGSDKHKQSFSKMLYVIYNKLPSKDFIDEKRFKLLIDTLKNIYKSLCSYNHIPKIEESFTIMNGNASKISYENFYYVLLTINLLLKQLIYLYILAYEMILFPVDIIGKWGFNGPVGLFIDKCNYKVIEKYIGKNNLEKIKESLKESDSVKSLLSWYNESPRLSENEIENSWLEFIKECKIDPSKLPTIKEQRIAYYKAHTRVTKWCLNYSNFNCSPNLEISDEISDKLLKKIVDW